MILNTVMVAVETAMVGVIAFIGLVVPHILRMLRSADYTFLMPASALLGALLMEVIDIVARLVISPAELPIGIITAVVGAPVFLWILLRGSGRGSEPRSMVEAVAGRALSRRRRAHPRRRERRLPAAQVQRDPRARTAQESRRC